jgi:hypothetical protein
VAARKREAGGRKLGTPWPKNGPGNAEVDKRRRNKNTRTKRTMRRRNIGFPNVLSVTMHLCF